MNLVVVGNPENRRTGYFCQAAKALNLPAPEVISYEDILTGRKKLSDSLTSHSLLRIESPGENFAVEKKLIARGAAICDPSPASHITESEALCLEPDYGRIRFLRQWFLGYENLLRTWENDIERSRCRVFNSPEAIRLMFDKFSCQRYLQAVNIAVPDLLPGALNYDELRDKMAGHGLRRVFIKPLHSSSASGVMAYGTNGNKEEIITSIELVNSHNETRFYNALKVRRYNDRKDIRCLIDFILAEGAVVEEWIPKASLDGNFFDIRVVVINGAAKFILPRMSKGPITNLHLGNQRGQLNEVKSILGTENFERMVQCAEGAARSLNGAFYAGVDILIPAGLGKPRVLELNAFGDLLPGLTYNGDDTYTTGLKDFLHAA